MSEFVLPEAYGLHRGLTGRQERSYQGTLELITKDKNGSILDVVYDHNIVKVPAKEILAHRLAPRSVWDPDASTGVGAWVDSGVDNADEFSPRYIVFGAPFGADHIQITNDPRYYSLDAASGVYVPNRLGVGLDYGGGLINPIPISEPTRPLKRIERVFFQPSYQPAGTPLLQSDVRAMNNVVVFETTLRKDEYNGFGQTTSDYFTITEVALVAAAEIGDTGACECDPHDLFLTGGPNRTSLRATATGTATVTLHPSMAAYVNIINEGDQIKIVGEPGGTGTTGTSGDADETLNQVNQYYLVISKALGGSDIVLDRAVVDANNAPITGAVGLLRDGFRIFSHRILKSPQKKSTDTELVCRWLISML